VKRFIQFAQNIIPPLKDYLWECVPQTMAISNMEINPQVRNAETLEELLHIAVLLENGATSQASSLSVSTQIINDDS